LFKIETEQHFQQVEVGNKR